jgi:hypothetical protein
VVLGILMLVAFVGIVLGWKLCRLFYDPEIRAGEKSWRLEPAPKADAPQRAAEARARARRQKRDQLERWKVN